MLGACDAIRCDTVKSPSEPAWRDVLVVANWMEERKAVYTKRITGINTIEFSSPWKVCTESTWCITATARLPLFASDLQATMARQAKLAVLMVEIVPEPFKLRRNLLRATNLHIHVSCLSRSAKEQFFWQCSIIPCSRVNGARNVKHLATSPCTCEMFLLVLWKVKVLVRYVVVLASSATATFSI